MSPSTRRDTTSCSPWWRSAWVSREEISSCCCIMEPFMVIAPGFLCLGGVGSVRLVGTRGAHECIRGEDGKQRHHGQCHGQAEGVRQQARDEGTGCKAEQVLEE